MYAPAQDNSIPFITPDKLKSYDVSSINNFCPSSPPSTCQSPHLSHLPFGDQAFLLGIATRYGNFPAQWKAFWDATGGLWMSGALHGKYCGLFVSTASIGGGQETTAANSMSTLVHHGIIYVPFGYARAFAEMSDLSEVRGGSAWGAGTIAGGNGERQPRFVCLEFFD